MAEDFKQFGLEQIEETGLTEEEIRALVGSSVRDQFRSNKKSIRTDVQIFTIDGTWNKPSSSIGKTACQVQMWGAGGGGGSGRLGAVNTDRRGGAGGGGGNFISQTFLLTDLDATVAITVAAAGVGGAAQATDDTNGNAGGNPVGSTTFGTFLSVFNGGGGEGGDGSAQPRGGGGASSAADANLGVGGAPAEAVDAIALQGTDGTSIATPGANADWGGGAAGTSGGSSVHSAGAGGLAGRITSSNVTSVGNIGGTTGSYTEGGGGAAGATDGGDGGDGVFIGFGGGGGGSHILGDG